MTRIVLLDSGPLGMVTNPKASFENRECTQWMLALVAKGIQVMVPEIADYEVRRELLRAKKTQGMARLDALKNTAGYIPLTTQTMLQAAEFWAQARHIGKPTASDAALDGDVILAAQSAVLTNNGYDVVIATVNVHHLALFAKADLWRNIS